jgi:uncharacterized OB-fold protein
VGTGFQPGEPGFGTGFEPLPEGWPLPQPSAESEPFWDGCRRGELRLQRCAGCGRFWFPPGRFCPECWGRDWAWEPTGGRGRVHSFVVYRRAYRPVFKDRLPYAVAVVELEEGPRLLTTLVGVEPERVQVGLPVEVALVPAPGGFVLPFFRPAAGGGAPVRGVQG